MTLDVWYWLFMALWLFFGLWRDRADPYRLGGHGLAFVLFLLIGLRVFGSPIK